LLAPLNSYCFNLFIYLFIEIFLDSYSCCFSCSYCVAVSAKKIIAEIVKGSKCSVDEIIAQLDCRIQKFSDELLLEECKIVLERSTEEVCLIMC
jgi:hypothetical protein